MKTYVLVALVAGFLVGADDPTKDKGKKGATALEGTWAIVSVTVEGETNTKAKDIGGTIVFKGKTVTFKNQRGDRKATFKIDPKKKTIEITFTEGPSKGKPIPGLYRLKGDELKWCHSRAGRDQPKRFTAEKGSGNVLVVLKRVKDKGDKKDKKLVPVEGKVTLNGKPLANATVEFVPVDKGGQKATGTTNEEGKYKLKTLGKKGGVRPGKYRVVISAKRGGRSIVPARYGPGGKAGITFEVPPGGTDKANLDLKTP
jgi:uncharacterized protein (TIGR03067 family)